MKRHIAALLLCGALTNTSVLFSQSSNSTPSRITLSAGIGLFPTYFKAGESSGLPPFTFKAGYDVSKYFSLGGFFGYSSTTAKPKIFAEGTDSHITNKTMVVGIRTEVRKDFSDRIQGYGGSMLGYHYANVNEISNTTNQPVVRANDSPTPINPKAKKGKMTYAAFMGANVKLTKRASIYGEIGYGISIANLGVTIRI